MFLLILAISIITAFAQIISTTFDLKNPLKGGLSKITLAGWFFYICTGILAFMPAIQKAIQDSIDNDKEVMRSEEQDERDYKLRRSYDSSLTEMKKKFDTTTNIVSETLGKYGYKLDSSNKVLVTIRDSDKATVTLDNPVLTLAVPPEKGIEYMGKKADGFHEVRVKFKSNDAGSSFYNLKFSFVFNINDKLVYTPLDNSASLVGPLWKNATGTIIYNFRNVDNFENIYMWVRGSYKRVDGSGNFEINEVFEYEMITKIVSLRTGVIKKSLSDFIQSNEK